MREALLKMARNGVADAKGLKANTDYGNFEGMEGGRRECVEEQ